VALVKQPLGEGRDRIARRVRLTLLVGAVHHLVVRERVRVGADHLGVHERRPLPLAGVRDGLLHHLVGGEQVAAVHLLDEQVREPGTSLEIEPPAVFTSTGTEIA
jgi:hypothetical protein